MNCRRLRRRLLAAERPDRPSAEAQNHLAECPECRAWHGRLTTVERQLSLLPVAPSSGKDRLLALLEIGVKQDMVPAVDAMAPTVRWPVRELPPRAVIQERGLRKIALAFALAATVAAFAVGLWAWPHWDHRLPGEESAAQKYERTLAGQHAARLSVPGTGRERVASLLEFEDSLKNTAVALARAGDAERLQVLVDYYDRVVNEDLLAQADTLTPLQRRDTLQRAGKQLRETESELRRLIPTLDSASEPTAVAQHLEAIAAAADRANQECQRRLLASA